MIFWIVKNNRKLAKFDYAHISTNQIIELHRLGYKFEPASSNLLLLTHQAG